MYWMFVFFLYLSHKKESRCEYWDGLLLDRPETATPAKNGPAPAAEQPRGGEHYFSFGFSEGNSKLF